MIEQPICGICGSRMKLRDVAPCLDCGGDPQEIDDWYRGKHRYADFGLFGKEVLCDFCEADMPSTDPLVWGFPKGFDWKKAIAAQPANRLVEPPPLRFEFACLECSNTLRKQQFVQKNAQLNGVTLPKEYWRYLT
jgi:hypothetical protein